MTTTNSLLSDFPLSGNGAQKALTRSKIDNGKPKDDLDAKRHAVSFILPAWNEEENIVRAIESTAAAAQRHCSDFEIVVVDDGSTDGTARLVEGLQSTHPTLRLLRHGTNRGYGEALHTGFSACQLEYVFFTDSDNQFDMDELPLLLAGTDHSDIVAGYRKVRRDPKMRLLNAWLWNRLVRLLFYVPVRDIDCAFKLFKRTAIAKIEIESRGAMINTEIMVKLARAGWRIVEVGVTHRPRQGGEPQGARLKVIARAFAEVARMYPHLSSLSLSEFDVDVSQQVPGHVNDESGWDGSADGLAYLPSSA